MHQHLLRLLGWVAYASLKQYLINREFFKKLCHSSPLLCLVRVSMLTWRFKNMTATTLILTELPVFSDINCCKTASPAKAYRNAFNLKHFHLFLTDVCCQVERHFELQYRGWFFFLNPFKSPPQLFTVTLTALPWEVVHVPWSSYFSFTAISSETKHLANTLHHCSLTLRIIHAVTTLL